MGSITDDLRPLDEQAFGARVEPHRRELHVHCYRLLGSFEEAEDLVQEAFLRAWRRRETYEGRASVRAWLYRIATNACLDALDKRPRRPSASGEVAWLQPYPDELLEQLPDRREGPEDVALAKETIELAFIAAIQHLAPLPRAVLVLRDVLGCSAKETAPTPRAWPRSCTRTSASRCRRRPASGPAEARSCRAGSTAGSDRRRSAACGAWSPAPTVSPRSRATCASRATPRTNRWRSTSCWCRTGSSPRSSPSTARCSSTSTCRPRSARRLVDDERPYLDHRHASLRCRPFRRGRADAGLRARHRPSRCARVGRHRHDGAAPGDGRHGSPPPAAERAGLRSRRHRHRRQHTLARRPLRRQPPLCRQADLCSASGARRRAQQGRLLHSRVGRGARRAVRAGRRRARAAARAPTRPGAGPHTRHADGRRRDWRAAGHRRRRRGGVVRRVRRAAHRRPAAGPCARPRTRLARARARAMATPHRLRHHVGVFRSVSAYMHEAMVAAYVRDATYVPMDDETLAPYVAPWLGAEGQEVFYRQIAQNDPRYTDEVQPLYGGIERPVLILWGEEDRWIPLERGRRLHEAIPGSRLETIPRCSYLAQEDATAAVVEHCKDFFG